MCVVGNSDGTSDSDTFFSMKHLIIISKKVIFFFKFLFLGLKISGGLSLFGLFRLVFWMYVLAREWE